MRAQTPKIKIGGPDYAPLTDAIRAFLKETPALAAKLGGAPAGWQVREAGGGNPDVVFIVTGPAGGLAVKQALPCVRLVGDTWPLPLERACFGHEALQRQMRHLPGHAPHVHHFDTGRAAIVMDYLTPHGILRKALFARNSALRKMTEDLVFTDPHRLAKLNRWTSQQLGKIAGEFRADAALKAAVQELKWRYLSPGEALPHGDLHTGPVMVTPDGTRVIDPEFALAGPIGFDTGAMIANFLLGFLSQDGHETRAGGRAACRRWLLETTEAIWQKFEQPFLTLWRGQNTGDAVDAGLFQDQSSALALEDFRKKTMARRILGLAHVEDMESIKDPDRRARCEKKALRLARRLMVKARAIRDTAELLRAAEDMRREAA